MRAAISMCRQAAGLRTTGSCSWHVHPPTSQRSSCGSCLGSLDRCAGWPGWQQQQGSTNSTSSLVAAPLKQLPKPKPGWQQRPKQANPPGRNTGCNQWVLRVTLGPCVVCEDVGQQASLRLHEWRLVARRCVVRSTRARACRAACPFSPCLQIGACTLLCTVALHAGRRHQLVQGAALTREQGVWLCDHVNQGAGHGGKSCCWSCLNCRSHPDTTHSACIPQQAAAWLFCRVQQQLSNTAAAQRW